MLRTFVQSADLTGEALTEFKQWLGISQSSEDALLLDLLAASLAMCEAFTGQSPLEQVVEERVAASPARCVLTSRPVRSVALVEAIAADGTRTALNASAYDVSVDATGVASFRLTASAPVETVVVQMVAGIAPTWALMPNPLRQGIIRLAAHYYRDRDHEGAAQPPASVAALWRPWRVVRLT